MEVLGYDSVEDHRPETLGSLEESSHPTSRSSVSKNHEEESCLENIHISVQISDCIQTFRRAAELLSTHAPHKNKKKLPVIFTNVQHCQTLKTALV